MEDEQIVSEVFRKWRKEREREGGGKGRREGERKEGRERGRKGGREEVRERGRKGGREQGTVFFFRAFRGGNFPPKVLNFPPKH